MSHPSAAGPQRIAIIGAGPAAFYAAEAILHARPDEHVEVDMFDRLPAPYGLVRYGVAPDHLKIKTVTASFARIASDPRFRFLGNVEFGRDLSLEDLRRHYHQVVFATGAQSDRRMGIPGEDLARSHPATEFVAWYNGHPAYSHLTFDLSHPAVAIVGVGNVAMDVARILCLSPAELARSDMADYAVEALSASKVRNIYLLGRRGPAQAAFTNPELKEIGELEEADVIVDPGEATLDPVTVRAVSDLADRALQRKVDMIAGYARREPGGRPRRLHLRFLVSPIELLDDGHGGVGAVRVVRNALATTEAGTIVARPTGQTETIDAGLVFRSVGYRGVPLPGLPFHDAWGTIPNRAGRVLAAPDSESIIPGLYVTGWIKRGPSGVIGTNKPDAVETVAAMAEDASNGITLHPPLPTRGAVDALLAERRCRPVAFADWSRLDQLELDAGARAGRPRLKFTSVEAMLDSLGSA